MTAKVELEACPFCGGKAAIKRNKTAMVSCTNCSASTFQILRDPESAIAVWNARTPCVTPADDNAACVSPAPVGDTQDDDAGLKGFVPCPTCKQYSHSIGNDAITAAYNHFHTMIAHPVRGHPMGDVFGADTQDAAKVLCATITRLTAERDAANLAFDINYKALTKQGQQLAATTAERDELRAVIGDSDLVPQGEHAAAIMKLVEQAARIAELEGALRTYGQHKTGCYYGIQAYHGMDCPCECGLLQILKETPDAQG